MEIETMFRRLTNSLTNKACLAGLVAVSVLSLWGGTRLASAQSSGWQAGLQQMARLQSLIEYYYMESGVYPVSLEAIEQGFNGMVTEPSMKVVIPVDPVTSKPFVYEVDNSRQTYTLSLPDPMSYGGHALTLTPVDWGWLSIAANQRRVERLTLECTHNIEILATRTEMYAKDHDGKFPPNLGALKPRYMPRIFTCPSMGMDYVYSLQPEKGYTISCPNPQSHGLERFTYNSEKGVDMKPLAATDSRKAKLPGNIGATPTPAAAPNREQKSAPKPSSGKSDKVKAEQSAKEKFAPAKPEAPKPAASPAPAKPEDPQPAASSVTAEKDVRPFDDVDSAGGEAGEVKTHAPERPFDGVDTVDIPLLKPLWEAVPFK
ncbi:MAG: hypothetical protein Q4F00_02650 [bacterium]|nr:hypothetical protein [bacterium]